MKAKGVKPESDRQQGSQWLRDEVTQRCQLEEENRMLRAAVANLRVQNAKLKFWLHQAGVCTVNGERIEGQ